MQWTSRNPEATRATARALAASVGREGLLVGLIGPLGAGKTVFAKGLAEGIGIDPEVVASPTFVIACEYRGPDGGRLAHVDLYRIQSAGELEGAGFLDLLEPGVLVAVEWADRFPEVLPSDRLEVCITRFDSADAPDGRRLEAKARGPRARAVLERWRTSAPGAETDPA